MSKKVTQDYDSTLVGQNIRAIENPDSIGFNNGIWYKSPRRGDDLPLRPLFPNNRPMSYTKKNYGLDNNYNNFIYDPTPEAERYFNFTKDMYMEDYWPFLTADPRL